MKQCSKCHTAKPVAEFHKERRSKDGLRANCKGCEHNAAKRQTCRACRKDLRVIDFPTKYHTCKQCLRDRNKKQCSKCRKIRALVQFDKSPQKRDGYHPTCKSCLRPKWKAYYAADPVGNCQRSKDRWAANRPRYRLNHQLRKFKMTLAELEQLIAAAGGLCMICRKPETRTRKSLMTSLCIDHCHVTGKVRGLLCSKCNSGIGLLGDDPVVVAAAVTYLEEARARLHG